MKTWETTVRSSAAIAGATLIHALAGAAGGQVSAGTPAARAMKLFKEVDLAACPGSFPCLGDLDNDGRVDFLLYRPGPQTPPPRS